VQFDLQDGRPPAALSLARDVTIGSHVVGTTVDVAVFADGGYSGRVLTWDLAGVTGELANLLAVPVALLIDQELGAATCLDVEVWDLEHGRRWLIPRDVALGGMRVVERMLDRTEAAIKS
jgi:hypothetical protein